ncbi:Uncharacterized membrane protein YhaH, DUF805 family [Bradyrhizobium lablabi]|uniref:Uncharacterized membrane protein YhaH, DUF805 family n=1 Tax=Bradyrhizobium lablabi TaxID=722472 RepID=A0A1M6SE30_9BRAD|nr:DUF805 domain-containing protein [Bradyrhizobium lablabi]SHK42970.1 Uncharacterized membrane protein YhaH, DUF805 family [Bradyrhizobium lablabi]
MDNSYTSNAFLFSFQGRINRAKYWYAIFASSVACLVFMSILAFAIGGITGAGVTSVNLYFLDWLRDFPSFPFTVSFRDAAPLPAVVLFYAMGAPIFVVGMWFLAAATIKRLHDRNKSGWWIVPFFIAPALLDRLSGWIDDPTTAIVVSAIAFGLTVWCFVELLFLRGTRGPNRFGPDPLAPVDTRPGWDQESEVEFVPHRGGPTP